ncbi:hypothetical protein OBBRIDRAFT_726717 [Obba rivulosa]|uniref:Phosphatidylglycerol/phosphatidylinositol transfer protein n=1 Tax=Obba rivulosa TaxID=1052685 RepID=A0A8E2AWT4_9APHY|nr:hypothetical protein OBBRIDRAFT_726717 [Obba rivulosa]
MFHPKFHSVHAILFITALSGLSAVNAAEQQQLSESVRDAHSSWAWNLCGTPSDIVEIKSLEINPDPPEKGQNLTITVKGVAKEQIEDGAYASVVITIGGIKLPPKEYDLCEEARKANASIQCPIEKGEHEVTQTVELPKEIPNWPISIQAQGFTADDRDLTCANFMVKFT